MSVWLPAFVSFLCFCSIWRCSGSCGFGRCLGPDPRRCSFRAGRETCARGYSALARLAVVCTAGSAASQLTLYHPRNISLNVRGVMRGVKP